MRKLSFRKKNNHNNICFLNEVIDSFNGTALKFEKHYQQLEKKVRELNIELENKNEALKINLKEKEDVKNYLNNILESLTTGVVVVDLQGRVTTFNQAAENITGLFSVEVVGQEFDRILGPIIFRNSHLNVRVLNDIRQNTEIETEIHQKGKNIFNVNLSISPVKNHQGKKVGIVLTLQDITHMKKLEEQVNRTDRLAAMGLFASILRKKLQNFGELKEFVEHISAGVASINNIISNLLLFIKPQQKANFQIIDIHDPLNDSQFFSSHLTKSNDSVEVITSYAPEPLMVYGDVELLKQIFLNLILNAIQAMPNGGKLFISTSKVDGLSHGSNFVEIKFADNGIGIPKENLTRIFDLFFTTKERGTGLGLAIVHNILKIHGGSIDINSSGEGGTTCVVTFPLCESKEKSENKIQTLTMTNDSYAM